MNAAVLWSLRYKTEKSTPAGCEALAWETCPLCGALAAVGFEPGSSDVAVECTAGCEVPPELAARLMKIVKSARA